MSEASEARHDPYASALRQIAEAQASKATSLYLNDPEMVEIPPEIAALWWLETLIIGDKLNYPSQVKSIAAVGFLSNLRHLEIHGSQLSEIGALQNLKQLRFLVLNETPTLDLSPLQHLTNLRGLVLTGSKVRDLTPIRDLPFEAGEAMEPNWGLSFADTPATENDPELRRLSEIPDAVQRTRETLAYLKTLPDPPSAQRPDEADDAPRRVDPMTVIRHAVLGQADHAAELEARTSRTLEQLQAIKRNVTRRSKRFLRLMRQNDASVEERLRAHLDKEVATLREERAVEAPIKLWQDKQDEHQRRLDPARKLFFLGLGLIAASVVGLLLALICWGPAIEAMLAPLGCTPTNPQACSGVSLRAILAVAAIMALFTVLLWFTRLQMKLFLAERHLVLDARERQAFAQTYVSLLRSPGTTEHALESRSVVYASLFRPSHDGIVSDDGGIDPGLLAALSKYLSQR